MSLPVLTPEQRKQALVKASTVRKARAAFKRKIADGGLPASEALDQALADPEVLGGLLVNEFLRCIPGIGIRRAALTLENIGIAANRRLRGVGVRQLGELRVLCATMDNKVNI